MSLRRTIWKRQMPKLIAIVGGSGAGKTWLAAQLQAQLGKDAGRLSADNFYRDRSHLSPGVRSRINFDHPRALDWAELHKTLKACSEGNSVSIPDYDFAAHSRTPSRVELRTKPVLLVDGLWLLRRPSIRRLFSYKIYLDCPCSLRLQRRQARDVCERGRETDSIKQQFLKVVAPMHARFVEPQKRWADLVFNHVPTADDVTNLTKVIKSLLT